MEVRPIDANVLEALFNKQIELGATDAFDAFDDALQDTPTLQCGECHNYDAAFDCRSSCANCERTLSLNTLRDEIYQDAVAHGLWMDTDGPMRCASQIDGEVQELFEEAGNVLDVRVDGGDETEVWAAYCEELADVIITGFSVAGKLGIDIDAAIRRKMEINKNRPWKHGKE